MAQTIAASQRWRYGCTRARGMDPLAMAERKARSMGEIWISRLNYVLGEDEHDLRECQDHLVSPVDELIKL